MGREKYSVIPAKIKILRRKNRLSQQMLAEMTDLSTNFIAQVEAGLRNPSFKTLNKIADALNVDINYFFVNDCKKDNKISEKDINELFSHIKRNCKIEDLYFLLEIINNILMRFYKK